MKQKIKYYPKPKGQVFHIDHVHVTWDQQVPLHQQETWELSYVITGGGKRIIGDLTENFSKGEIILIPPNIPHCWSFDQDIHDESGKIENITVIFDNDFLEGCKKFFPELFRSISRLQHIVQAVSFQEETLQALQHLMKDIICHEEHEKAVLFIRILQRISSGKKMRVVGKPVAENKKEKQFMEIYLYVLSHFQRPITLEEVSQQIGMQKSAFCVFFKEMAGKSFFTYLTEFRIASSCEMLLKTKLSVAEISIASGFSDIPHYNRVFKKIKGTTPTEFRKNNGTDDPRSAFS